MQSFLKKSKNFHPFKCFSLNVNCIYTLYNTTHAMYKQLLCGGKFLKTGPRKIIAYYNMEFAVIYNWPKLEPEFLITALTKQDACFRSNCAKI